MHLTRALVSWARSDHPCHLRQRQACRHMHRGSVSVARLNQRHLDQRGLGGGLPLHIYVSPPLASCWPPVFPPAAPLCQPPLPPSRLPCRLLCHPGVPMPTPMPSPMPPPAPPLLPLLSPPSMPPLHAVESVERRCNPNPHSTNVSVQLQAPWC